MVGAVVGGFVMYSILGFNLGSFIWSIIVATIGAIILRIICRLIVAGGTPDEIRSGAGTAVVPVPLQFEGPGLRGALFVLGRLQGLPGELEELLFGRSLRQARGGFGDGDAGGFDALV